MLTAGVVLNADIPGPWKSAGMSARTHSSTQSRTQVRRAPIASIRLPHLETLRRREVREAQRRDSLPEIMLADSDRLLGTVEQVLEGQANSPGSRARGRGGPDQTANRWSRTNIAIALRRSRICLRTPSNSRLLRSESACMFAPSRKTSEPRCSTSSDGAVKVLAKQRPRSRLLHAPSIATRRSTSRHHPTLGPRPRPRDASSACLQTLSAAILGHQASSRSKAPDSASSWSALPSRVKMRGDIAICHQRARASSVPPITLKLPLANPTWPGSIRMILRPTSPHMPADPGMEC